VPLPSNDRRPPDRPAAPVSRRTTLAGLAALALTAVVVTLALGGRATAVDAPAVAVPVAPAQAPAAASPDACSHTGASAALCTNPPTSSLRLVVESIPLANAVVGQAYERRLLAGAGMPPYRFQSDGASLPPGLELTADGRLVGTPTTAGSYRFSARVTDSAPVPNDARQQYALRVVAPKAAAKPEPKKDAAQPVVVDWNALDHPAPDRNRAVVWMLTKDDVDALLNPPSDADIAVGKTGAASASAGSDDEKAADAGAANATVNADSKLYSKASAEVLQRHIGVEFPTRQQLESSLEDVTCDKVRDIFAEQKQWSADATARAVPACYPTPKPASRDTKHLDAYALAGEILLDDLRTRTLDKARKYHAFALAPVTAGNPEPPLWAATKSCACIPESLRLTTYGLFPFWRGETPPAPPKDEKAGKPAAAFGTPVTSGIDFGAFKRIGYFGVTFDGSGRFTSPMHWQQDRTDFTQLAHRYGSKLDLVLYRADWSDLKRILSPDGTTPTAQTNTAVAASLAGNAKAALGAATASATTAAAGAISKVVPPKAADACTPPKPEPKPDTPTPPAIATLVDGAMNLVNQPLTDTASIIQSRVPFFATANHMGDGITLFFDPPDASAPEAADYPGFMQALLRELVARMQAADRPLALNLVIRGDRFAKSIDGPDSVRALFDLMLMAEQPLMTQGNKPRICNGGTDYVSRTHVSINFLVLMSEPTKRTKKQLKTDIEKSPYLGGVNRQVFVRKVIPLLTPGTYAAPDSPKSGDDDDDSVQLDDDLAYMADGFGGVGFWSLPFAAYEGLDLPDRVRRAFVAKADREPGKLCGVLCPNRWPLRIAVEALGLIELIGFPLCLCVCSIRRRWGGKLLTALLIGGAVFIALALGMLTCDPALASVREGNTPFIVLIAALLLWGLYRYTHPDEAQP